MFVCPDCGRSFPAAGFCTEHGASLLDAHSDPMLGAMVGSYRITRKLGEGGMGQVYRAVHPNIGSRVAIKLLNAQCSQSPALVERFFAEAKAVNVIQHEGIVAVSDLASLPDGRPYIVMECLEGNSLAQLIRERGALPLGFMASVLGQVLDALAAAHDKSIIHRDLKPDNVFVTSSGRVKLLDFGIAKLQPELGGISDATRTGSLLGTPHYMSPEQAQGMSVDQRADLYAAGVILFEAATGQRPYPNVSTLYELLKAQVELMPPQPSLLRPDIPRALEDVMLRALQKNPAHRFQTAREFSAALAAAARLLPPGSYSSDLGLVTSGSGSAISPLAQVASPAPFTPPPLVATPAPLAPLPPIALTPPEPPRQTWNALTIVLLVLGFLALAFIGSCMACTMCVGAAGA